MDRKGRLGQSSSLRRSGIDNGGGIGSIGGDNSVGYAPDIVAFCLELSSAYICGERRSGKKLEMTLSMTP